MSEASKLLTLQKRIEELERHNQSLANDFQRFYDAIPWEEIETAQYFLSRLCESYAGPKGVAADLCATRDTLSRVLALREQEEGNE